MKGHTLKDQEFVTEELTRDRLREVDRDRSKLKIITEAFRPGAYVACRGIELKFYRPGSTKNDLYDFYSVNFDDISYFVMAVPMKDKGMIEAFLKEHGLRLQNGIPHSISAQGMKVFPMRDDSCFQLGGTDNNVMYSGPSAADAVREGERAIVARFEREHEAWFGQQERMWYLGQWWRNVTGYAASRFGDKGLEFYKTGDGRIWLRYEDGKRLQIWE